MDKLYWIACDDKDTTLFEGRYQGRTRGDALKFLKESARPQEPLRTGLHHHRNPGPADP